MTTTEVMTTRARSGATDSDSRTPSRRPATRTRRPSGAGRAMPRAATRPSVDGANPALQDGHDQELVTVTGILDVVESYAFIRTSGYLAGPDDAYVSPSQIKQYGLRPGDEITGAVRATRSGEFGRAAGKAARNYPPLARIDSVNGMDPQTARSRPDFYKLTPLHPQERLRLETESHILTTRVIDLVMPIGKGQRALIVSPPKAGKTMIQQA
ncbi:MAG TPA: transcription termination factor Rho, partial [Micromonosporaceae bacterium]